MRKICYCVAASLDGYLAGPNGEADWIVMDPDIDFTALFSQFDTFLMGRKTFEMMVKSGQGGSAPGTKTFVFSKTLRQGDYADVTIVAEEPKKLLAELRKQPGKDIWLFGGGELFRSLLEAGCVDRIEVAVVPVLLGEGIPLLPAPAKRAKLKLVGHKVYAKSGIVALEYEVK